MAAIVIMPKQGLQMTEGTITRWIKKEGERVEQEEPLFEMETDKLSIEICASMSGTLLRIIRGEGETVPITHTIAVIGEPGEDISDLLEEEQKNEEDTLTHQEVSKPLDLVATASGWAQEGQRVFITPRARMAAEKAGIDHTCIHGSGPDGMIIERDVTGYKSSTTRVTPVANRIARQNGVELSGLNGSGARGKIMKEDVKAAIAEMESKCAPDCRKDRVIPFGGMRKVISDRMTKSLHTMAQANHRMRIDMTEAICVRERLKAHNVRVSFTDMLVKVVSRALLDFPILNSSLADEGILVRDYVNMGIAVAVENGLIVPVIRDADTMSLKEISQASAALIDRAKNGKLKQEEYTGGTFTITNLGMFDIDEFTAIINPPESAILAVGKIERVPVVEGDNVVIRPVMMLSLTYDHRIIDGAPAAQFLQRVKQIMQNPYLLI